jgi:hypothetical protein
MAGAATYPETACGRRGDDHRFPEASANRGKVEGNGAKACQGYAGKKLDLLKKKILLMQLILFFGLNLGRKRSEDHLGDGVEQVQGQDEIDQLHDQARQAEVAAAAQHRHGAEDADEAGQHEGIEGCPGGGNAQDGIVHLGKQAQCSLPDADHFPGDQAGGDDNDRESQPAGYGDQLGQQRLDFFHNAILSEKLFNVKLRLLLIENLSDS